MKEQPIIFNSEMSVAYIEDRKTNTRRPIKEKLSKSLNKISYFQDGWYQDEGNNVYFGRMDCPYGQVGDIVPALEDINGDKSLLIYLGDIEITDVSVERLTDISEEDSKKEGMIKTVYRDGPTQSIIMEIGHLQKFIDLWNSIYGKTEYKWQSNPWVWVVEFERVKQ